jgi:hypothetical protein
LQNSSESISQTISMGYMPVPWGSTKADSALAY